ncbi:hypothetical protein DFH05DRAFT_1523957 [Lentinula detonsa]|uniref:Uncharacterized protein n=1 Tax=Lentinula detonsa TaxID=2804962 RepID=A0A9W8P2M4_9AGAR|nr:hypothetical protein DFH05DRAFT_1523957 [Lentinula detonsa]
MFEVAWKSGDHTWLPFEKIENMEALSEYLEALGVKDISALSQIDSRDSPIEGLDTFAGSIEYIDYINRGGDQTSGLQISSITAMSVTESINMDTPADTPARPGSKPSIAFNIQNFPNVTVDWPAQRFFICDADTNVEYSVDVDELITFIHTSGAIAKKWAIKGGIPTKYIGVIGALWEHIPPDPNAYFSYKDDDDNVTRSKALIRYDHVFTSEQIEDLTRNGRISDNLIDDMGNTFPKPTPAKGTDGNDQDGVGGMMRMYSNMRVRQTAFIHGLVIATEKAQFQMAKQQAGKEERARKRAARAKPYQGKAKKNDIGDASTTISLRNKMEMWAVRGGGSKHAEDDKRGEGPSKGA